MRRKLLLGCILGLVAMASAPAASSQSDAKSILAYRGNGEAVIPVSDSTVIAEAEEFRPDRAVAGGWQAQRWGENYYAATLANTFLSRKAFLGATEQAEGASAGILVHVPKSGRYLALARYEAAPRFCTRFRLRIEQGGKTKLDRLYGERENVKIWAFGQRLKTEAYWSWGAVENIVWEGHDAFVDLDEGEAKLTLIAEKQPAPGARRNVDLVMLTSDIEQVKRRIEKEQYLPLDGMLTQAGDVYVRLHNRGGGAMTLRLPNGIEHSPYWVHMREWKAVQIKAGARQSSDWVEVGSLLDALNDGQWRIEAAGEPKPKYDLEFAVRSAAGKIESIGTLVDLTGSVELAYFADTRYSRRIQTTAAVLYDLVEYLRKQPVQGVAPKRTLIYGYTFERRPNDSRFNTALDEFMRLMGATALNEEKGFPDREGLVRGYIDVRDKGPKELEGIAQKLRADGVAEKIACVSLGDEIGLQSPGAKDNAAFVGWLKSQNLKPFEIDFGAGDDWSKVVYSPAVDPKTKPGSFYYSQLYRQHYGIAKQKELTDALRRYLPNAGIGANFSPHHGQAYLGQTYQWVTLFREGGMTMPWSEDYIWQPPVGSQQMNFIGVDLFRAGLKGRAEGKIHMYVMPHWPGNTPASWRRQFYGDIAHGTKIFNLFEFRPVQAAYTENHVSLPAMYQEVRTAIHELGKFEDIMQEGHVRPGIAGLWFSETADIWNDNRPPFAAAKRCLYIAIRHQQLPLDVVVEQDVVAGDLRHYKILFLTDPHVSRKASKAIADWVRGGGRLFATAGAGMFDELNQPNEALREVLGVDEMELQQATEPITYEKQDLPFATPLAHVAVRDAELIPCFGAASVMKLRADREDPEATAVTCFNDARPAIITRAVGKGSTAYFGFLPGLSYFKPAVPLRPADRGTNDESMAHLIPTQFDQGIARLLEQAAAGIDRPVVCSEPRVESTIIESARGIVVPLVNWSGKRVGRLAVRVNIPLPSGKAELASGRPLQRENGVFRLDLDVADALILRP